MRAVLKLSHMVVKLRQCLVKMTSLCDIASQCIQGLLEVYFKMKAMMNKKKIPFYFFNLYTLFNEGKHILLT